MGAVQRGREQEYRGVASACRVRRAGRGTGAVAQAPPAATGACPYCRDPTFWYTPRMLRTQYHRMMRVSLRSTLDTLSQSVRLDGVLASWTDPDGTTALRFARERNLPCGIIVGGTDVLLLTANARRREVITRTLRGADHVFAVGSHLVQQVIGLGVAPEQVSSLLRGVDLGRFEPGERSAARSALGLDPADPLLLWAGNMLPVKAPERAIEALALLRVEWPALRLAMIGDGPLRSTLEALTAARGLGDAVLFAGPVAHEKLPLWYQACDAFVLPSRSEGVPNVLLETMATGRPFVASDVGAIRDLLPFGPSAVTPAGDIAALARALTEVLHDPARATLAPVRHDRLDGARHLLTHLRKARTAP